jgi:hypothetical protein
VPGAAAASPVVAGSSGTDCTFLGTGTLANCSLFALDPFSPDPLREGSFDTAADVALFAFSFAEASRLSVTTSSYAAGNFDPTLGLFRSDGAILELPDSTPARFFDIDIFGNFDDHIDLTLGPGSYLMALVVGNLRDSLLGGFECDTGCDFMGGAAFRFDASAEPVGGNTDPVPEPATVTLVAGGAIAGWLQRRRARARAQAARISR